MLYFTYLIYFTCDYYWRPHTGSGGSRLIHFLQLRRFLRSLDGCTNTGGSPKCFTHPMCCDLITRQSIKEWYKLGLDSSLAFWMVQTIDGAVTSTLLVFLSQKSIDALNLHGQVLLKMGIPMKIVLFITILQNQQSRIMLCHDRFMTFKTNRYYSQSNEIHLGLG